MTPKRFKQCVDRIGWSMRGLADRLGLGETTLRRWAEGRYPVPDDVAEWLETLAAVHEAHPHPAIHNQPSEAVKCRA